MGHSRLTLPVAIGIFVMGLLLMTLLNDEQYMLFSAVLLLAALLPFFIRFEQRQVQARELVLLAALAAVAAVSRIPFVLLPSVQPTTFVIIVSALVFGAESGFMIGAMAALVSNMVLGQGPWTPWQMFCWGMVGASAGWLNQWGWLRHRPLLLVFGFIWGFLFGWIMNLWAALGSLAYKDWTLVFTFVFCQLWL